MDITGKVVVVTGAARGIGIALVRRFSADGARAIVLCDLDAEGLKQAADQVGGIPMPCDVGDPAQVTQVVQETLDRFGCIDLYCANAGIMERGGITVSDEAWRRSLDINLMAHVYAARACLPGMIERKRGYFLFTVSAAGLLTQLGAVAYSVSKHAAVGFAEWLAVTHGDQGIKVSMLCPQAVQTAMIDGIDNGGVAGLDGILSADQVADCAASAIRNEDFLALPHAKVEKYMQYKSGNYSGWINSMQQLSRKFPRG